MAHAMRAAHYSETEKRLQKDPVVERMAADLRMSGRPRSEFCHDDGGPRSEFMITANNYHRKESDFAGPVHLGGVAAAVISLAYDTDPHRYTLRSTTTDGELRVDTLYAVTRTELALRIPKMVPQRTDAEDTLAVHISEHVALVYDESGREQAAFTITVDDSGRH